MLFEKHVCMYLDSICLLESAEPSFTIIVHMQTVKADRGRASAFLFLCVLCSVFFLLEGFLLGKEGLHR